MNLNLKLINFSHRWNSLNRYWVIGLEFAEGAFQGSSGNVAAIEQLDNWLNKSQYGFVEKFIQDYFIFSMRKVKV